MGDGEGQVALVTGGASGIGRAIAERLSARGARVVVADRDGDGAAAVAAANGGSAMAVDLADPAAAARLVGEVFATHGRLDLLVSNGGLSRNKRLLKEDLDSADLDRLFEVNFTAALRLAQVYLAGLEARDQHGRMLVTGSENSLSVPAAVKGFGLGMYVASKHALLIACEWLRDELAGAGKPLSVSVLLPGGVYTGMTAAGLGPDPDRWPAEMGIITPERCAELALAGLDAGLFYIPTHAHLADDMTPRAEGIRAALATLGLSSASG